MKTIVIAEMGENHYGNWEICRAMVEQAAAGGATYAKFQTYTAEEFGRDHPWYDEFRRVAMPTSVHFEMQRLCGEKGIAFLSSAFTKGSVSFLVDKMGRNALKLASSRVNQLDLLDYVNSRADQVRTVYLSTGMATLFRKPKMSVNQSLTNRTLCSFAAVRTYSLLPSFMACPPRLRWSSATPGNTNRLKI